MRYLVICILSFSIVFFTGCSNKSVPKKETIEKSAIQDSQEDLFLDEFDDEFTIEEKPDPFNSYNRKITSFNDGVFEYVLMPISKGYDKVMPDEVQNSIANFFENIVFPIRLANNLLQGKVQNSIEETGRFIINTTIGIVGFFDPAKSYFKLEAHKEDFGQTLGYWGVGAGPHIVLPFFGPSNLRDTVSIYPNSLLNPSIYYHHRGYNLTKNSKHSLYVKAFQKVNESSIQWQRYEKIREDAVDLYPYLRDAYEQYRQKQIEE